MQHARHVQPLDQRSQLWVVKHWMLSLLDRGRRYTTGLMDCLMDAARCGLFSTVSTRVALAAGKLTQALSVHPQLSALFVDWQGSEVSAPCQCSKLLHGLIYRQPSRPAVEYWQ